MRHGVEAVVRSLRRQVDGDPLLVVRGNGGGAAEGRAVVDRGRRRRGVDRRRIDRAQVVAPGPVPFRRGGHRARADPAAGLQRPLLAGQALPAQDLDRAGVRRQPQPGLARRALGDHQGLDDVEILDLDRLGAEPRPAGGDRHLQQRRAGHHHLARHLVVGQVGQQLGVQQAVPFRRGLAQPGAQQRMRRLGQRQVDPLRRRGLAQVAALPGIMRQGLAPARRPVAEQRPPVDRAAAQQHLQHRALDRVRPVFAGLVAALLSRSAGSPPRAPPPWRCRADGRSAPAAARSRRRSRRPAPAPSAPPRRNPPAGGCCATSSRHPARHPPGSRR